MTHFTNPCYEMSFMTLIFRHFTDTVQSRDVVFVCNFVSVMVPWELYIT